MKSKKIIATLVASLFISNMGGYLVKANPNVNNKQAVVDSRQAIIETAIPQSEMTASATSEEAKIQLQVLLMEIQILCGIQNGMGVMHFHRVYQ